MTKLRVCGTGDVSDGEARRVDVGGFRLAVVRLGDAFHVVDDRCTHADYSLSDGEVWGPECMLECWKHGSRFSLLTGEPETLPATRSVRVYEVTVDGGDVYADLSEEVEA